MYKVRDKAAEARFLRPIHPGIVCAQSHPLERIKRADFFQNPFERLDA